MADTFIVPMGYRAKRATVVCGFRSKKMEFGLGRGVHTDKGHVKPVVLWSTHWEAWQGVFWSAFDVDYDLSCIMTALTCDEYK